jgi:hypothetical protein
MADTTPPPTPADRSLTAPLWAARILWTATGIVLALAVDRTEGMAASGALMAAWWTVVAGVLVALVVPGCLGLTLVRFAVPGSVPAAVLLVAATASDDAVSMALSAGGAVLVVAMSALVLWSGFGEAMVQGSAYGHERRLPLRPPVAHTVAIIASWCIWTTVATLAVAAAADDRPAAAAGLAAAGIGGGAVLVRSIHRFSRRWLVLVPAGLVVHDHVVLGETLMVPRQSVASARLAPAGTEALDLTGPAAGFAIEVAVRSAATVLLAADRLHPRGVAVHATSFLVAPSRPGRALRAAAAHRLPVG